MIKVLFVCHGNICRSPMSEFVMKDLVRCAGLEDRFEIASAATTTEEIWNGRGNPVYPPAKVIMNAHGIRCDGKRATLFRKEDYPNYDYIIGMDRENLNGMRRICGGDPEKKFSLLMDYTDCPRNVADPWYTRDFQTTWDDVWEGCHGLLNTICAKEDL